MSAENSDSNDELFHAKAEVENTEATQHPLETADKNVPQIIKHDVLYLIYMRKINGIREFLVRWRGYDDLDSTWEKEDDLCRWRHMINSFMSKEEIVPSPVRSESLAGRPKTNKPKPSTIRRWGKDRLNEKNDEGSIQEWPVNRLVYMRKRKGKREFLIEWEGFSFEEATWEWEESMTCPDLIAEFLKK